MKTAIRTAGIILLTAGVLWLTDLLFPLGEAAWASLMRAVEVSAARISIRLPQGTVLLDRTMLDQLAEKMSALCTLPPLLGDALHEIASVVCRALMKIYV